jgi:DNA-binding NarL/FixJ family response regulator
MDMHEHLIHLLQDESDGHVVLAAYHKGDGVVVGVVQQGVDGDIPVSASADTLVSLLDELEKAARELEE